MNYLETIKNITKDKKRKTENLVLLIILLVMLLVVINYIFDDNNSIKSTNINNEYSTQDSNVSKETFESDLETKLSNILSQVSGISDVSVLLTYTTNSKQNVVYNTKEESAEGKVMEERTVAYNEEGGEKKAIIESIEMPKIEGAIIVAKGANSVEIKSKLATTISSVTGIPVYRVQVFEKQG